MSNRIRDDYEGVIRLVHSDEPARYERIWAAIQNAVILGSLAILIWLCGQMVLTSVAQADAAVATSTGAICTDYGTQHVSCE